MDGTSSTRPKLRGERGPPPYFAGRDAELGLMRQRLEIALHEHDPGAEGVLLFTGVPGVGKTRLAKHFVHQQADNTNVKTLVVGTGALASPEGLIRLIGRAMDAEDRFAKAAGMDDKVSGARAGVAGLVSGGFTLDPHRPALKFFHMLHATKDLAIWRKRALVLVVDEVQNTDAQAADQLLTLHKGEHGCPILTIAAGLQHSKSVLSLHGISRMSHHELGLLSHEETVAAIYRGLSNLGVEVTEDTAGILADASMRFPQHVHVHIEAACKVYEERGEIDSPDAIAYVLKIGREARERYYMGRMAAMNRVDELFPLVEYIESRDVEIVTKATAVSIVGNEVMDAAIQHGLMTSREDNAVSFGIPSFRNYMIRRAAEYREIDRGQVIVSK